MAILSILAQITEERERQDNKWGEQNHSDGDWSLIFNEEYGEAAKARLEEDYRQFRKELVESAAVLVAWIEAIDRRGLFR